MPCVISTESSLHCWSVGEFTRLGADLFLSIHLLLPSSVRTRVMAVREECHCQLILLRCWVC